MVGGNRRPGAVAMQVADDVASRALAMRLRGMSYPDIARVLDYTTEGARKAVIRGMAEARTERAETAAEVREQEAARLDRMLTRLADLLDDTDDPQTALAIQDRMLRVQDRRARLLGLDLQRLEVTGANGGPIQIAAIQRVIVDPQQGPVVDVAPSAPSTSSTPTAVDAPSAPLALPSPDDENASKIKDLAFAATE